MLHAWVLCDNNMVPFTRDILGLQDIQTDLAKLIGEQGDDVKLIGMCAQTDYTYT